MSENVDLTDDDLREIETRYGDSTPTVGCPVCGVIDWSAQAVGGGRVTWACRNSLSTITGGPRDKIDWDHYSESRRETSIGDDRIVALVAEIRRHRAAQSASADRLRQMVRDAANTELDACDGDLVDSAALADSIADRVAAQLAEGGTS